MKFEFQGYSDDTFGELISEIDFDNSSNGEQIVFEVMYKDESGVLDGLLVIGQYCPSGAVGWMIGVAPHPNIGQGDGPIPDWPIQIVRSDSDYTPKLIIEAPDSSYINCMNKYDDDYDED